MPMFRLTIEYEGTRYSGWQVQTNTSRTVQGQLLRVARELFGEVDLGGAGRTDAGVHAAAQVAHLRIQQRAEPHQLLHAMNDLLPHDIHLLDVTRAPERFHARHDAGTRVYLYQISRRRTAFGKPFVWWIKDTLNVSAMQAAAALLVGMHDFTSFTDKRAVLESPDVLVEKIEVGEHGELILIRMAASHFLWKMVRKSVGALVEVGRGNLSPAELLGLLDARQTCQWTAPPSGLFLESVLYEGETFDRPLLPLVPVPVFIPPPVSTSPSGRTSDHPPKPKPGRRNPPTKWAKKKKRSSS